MSVYFLSLNILSVYILSAYLQSRFDRDKYIEIVWDNISDKFKPDFEMVDKPVSNSRGFPFDYRSLMHYSKYAFTRNGRETIKVSHGWQNWPYVYQIVTKWDIFATF